MADATKQEPAAGLSIEVLPAEYAGEPWHELWVNGRYAGLRSPSADAFGGVIHALLTGDRGGMSVAVGRPQVGDAKRAELKARGLTDAQIDAVQAVLAPAADLDAWARLPTQAERVRAFLSRGKLGAKGGGG